MREDFSLSFFLSLSLSLSFTCHSVYSLPSLTLSSSSSCLVFRISPLDADIKDEGIYVENERVRKMQWMLNRINFDVSGFASRMTSVNVLRQAKDILDTRGNRVNEQSELHYECEKKLSSLVCVYVCMCVCLSVCVSERNQAKLPDMPWLGLFRI